MFDIHPFEKSLGRVLLNLQITTNYSSIQSITLRFRIRQSDSEDRSGQISDDIVRRPRHPPHVPLHEKHGQHPRRQLQVRLRQVVQVRESEKESGRKLLQGSVQT